MKVSPPKLDISNNENEVSFYRKILNRVEFRIALKAGVAACLSLYAGVYFSIFLGRPDYLLSGTWCVLSTFVVLQAHLGGTYRAAWVRFLGVLLGSFMGGLFTSLFGSTGVTLGISVVATVLICSALKLKESIRIACLSLSVVMILWGLHPEMSPWVFGLYRFLDSSLGVIIAVIVSHTLWPAKAVMKMRVNMANTLRMINRLFQMELSLKPPPKNFDKIHRKLTLDISTLLDETRLFLKESELELLTKTRSIEQWSGIIDHLENIFESTQKLRVFQELNIKKILDKKLTAKLADTMESVVKAFTALSKGLRSADRKIEKTSLGESVESLNQELNRFRTTRATRKFEREEVEYFFVFFFHLRRVIEELLVIEDKIITLLEESL